jgi:hypothetical protein
MRPGSLAGGLRPAPADLAAWLLGFTLVAYLGLEGGGYDPLVYDQAGIAVWWIVLLGTVATALPRRAPGPLAWAALGLFAAFAGWTALSLGWTESQDKTFAEVARAASYLGIFVLAVFVQAEGGARRMVGAVAAAVALVAAVAVLSRLHPSWFPAGDETAAFLTSGRERLSYPLHYWNALAALVAMGLPLMLHLATGAKSAVARGFAGAAIPLLVLTIFLTLSRTGMAAAALALLIFLVFTSDRFPRLVGLAVTGAGGAVLVFAASGRDALQEGFMNETARQQGDELLAILIVVCLIVGLAQAGLSTLLLDRERRPRWTTMRRDTALAATVGCLLVAFVAALALGAPSRGSDAWDEFKHGGRPGDGTARLTSAAGQSRYQFWSAAVDQNASEPLTGTGAGTFEYWWTRNGDLAEIVRDTHNLYLQTLGELGIVGFALLVALFLTILGGGVANLTRAREERPALAAALAGCAAFMLASTFDWNWQMPVLPAALFLLAAALLARPGEGRRPLGRRALPARVGVAVLAVAAVVAIAIPLGTESLLRQSETAALEGDLGAALEDARAAEAVQPGAAAPRLQQALLLEAGGELDTAAAAARAATEREATNWRTWLIRARVEAERGRAAEAVGHYRRARALNPYSALFD